MLAILISASVTACGQGARGNPAPPSAWSVGFWIWSWSAIDATAAGGHPFDVLYVQVGRVDDYHKNSASWPWGGNMPPAKEYWALWRCDPPAKLNEIQIPVIAGDFIKRKEEAAAKGQTIVGLQLDYDCPTNDLAEYASFLEKLKRALPGGTKISITALLDWFRTDTKIREVLAHTNEFVPQFYDNAPSQGGATKGIAEPIDFARWGKTFNSFKVPYHVGISTFGRILAIQNGSTRAFRDLAPLDVLEHPGLKSISVEQTASGERRSVMQVERPTQINYWPLKTGDRVEIIMPTRQSVLAGCDAVKQMGEFCSGVIFFRWPGSQESLVLNPSQVLSWITHADIALGNPTLAAEEGNCAAVSCMDLDLRIPNQLPENTTIFTIRSSLPLEYFLVNEKIKSRISVTGASTMRLELPAFHGTGRVYLGRAVTLEEAKFTVVEEK